MHRTNAKNGELNSNWQRTEVNGGCHQNVHPGYTLSIDNNNPLESKVGIYIDLARRLVAGSDD